MAGVTVYIRDPSFERELARDPQTKAANRPAAEEALRGAQQAWPVRTGYGRRSLELVDAESGPQLVSTSSFWHWIEYGTVKTPPYAPLRRGVEGAGCKFVDVRSVGSGAAPA